MATFTFEISDAQAVRVVNAFAVTHGYPTLAPDGTPNPQTKAQFFRQKLIEHIRETVQRYEHAEAIRTVQAPPPVAVT